MRQSHIIAVMLLLVLPLDAWAQLPTFPYLFKYQIPFPPPPRDGEEAILTFPSRAVTVVNSLACSDDLNFYQQAFNKNDASSFPRSGDTPPDNGGNNENITSILIAKIAWPLLNSPGLGPGWFGCKGQADIEVNAILEKDNPDLVSALRSGDQGRALSQQIKALYSRPTPYLGAGTDCDGDTDLTVATTDHEDGLSNPPYIHVEYSVSPGCLKRQVNFALSRMVQTSAFGSTGLPCNLGTTTTKGEWDVTVRDLVRLLFLDQRWLGPVGGVLDPKVHDWVRDHLITLNTALGPPAYRVVGCGDTERTTGTPQEVIDDEAWRHDAASAIGDIWDWLAWRLFLILIVIGAAGTLVALTSPVIGWAIPIAATAAVVGLPILTAAIPETENHRLNIESSRFLKNQIKIEFLGENNLGGSDILNNQAKIKGWLLLRMQDILQHDFIEYNSPPYQRYSITSLLNLADFSHDHDVKLAAKMVLQYSVAKFAVGSNQGRRVVPFRRLMTEVKCIMESCVRDTNPPTRGPKEELELSQGDDYQISLGLLFNGQTQQLPKGKATLTSMHDMIYAATSNFRPFALIPDLAIRKDTPYFQSIHHAGYEIYSSGPSALISAGGVETDFPYGLVLPTGSYSGNTKDRGAAVPTTIILSRDPASYQTLPTPQPPDADMSRMTIDSYIRLEGLAKNYDSDTYTFENSACGRILRAVLD